MFTNVDNMNSSSIPVVDCVDKWVNNIHEQNVQLGQDSIVDSEPHLEMKFDSEAAAYDFYNEYSKKLGFGIRREYVNKSKKDGVLTSRKFTCFKEGIRGVDKRRQPTGKRNRAETRTDCQARMVIRLDRKIGKYKVVDFVAKHNHPLQPQKPKGLHEYISKQAGGLETVGFTKQDLKNYLRTKRMHSLKFGEVGALIKYFKHESENPSFFYDFQMDVDDEITNIFWADAQMINDYGYFGDVITFDTTYKTNKDYRPLGVFVGLNNHRQTIIFGAALLYDETIPSFQWLFETFLKAMGGAKPKTILTDQDAVMAKAVSLVMPETFHGLCTWHIRQNAIRHVNHLYQKSSQFGKDFEACIDLHEEEGEFLQAWSSLLVEHNVSEGSWLHTIFQLKEKWAWTYVRKTFTAGMRAVNGKRNNESEEEYASRHKLPRLMNNARMLVQAGKVYTPKIFEEFQAEYQEYQDTCIKEVKEGLYVVTNYDNAKERMVMGNIQEQGVSCDCRKFETHEILCSHALKVLDVMNIKLIPEHYILKRWTRDARLGSNKDWQGKHVELDVKADFMKRYNELCPRMIKLINKASVDHETYTFLSKVSEESNKIIDDILEKKHVDKEASGVVHVSISIANDEIENNVDTVGGAADIKKRDCSHKKKKRAKSWVERLHRKRKTCLSSNKKRQSSHQQAMLSQSSQVDTSRLEAMLTPSDQVDTLGLQHQATSQFGTLGFQSLLTPSSQVDTLGLQHQATSQFGTLGFQGMLTQSSPVDISGLRNFF
ncbi:unnamed protein product [Trifolium pratense]|uniref:Uncharacterized protein n=1 Tax=Trifolium pratense TaxID=57577 RepID=A0ACB0L3H8_TRIPR|nr:unnamed protein product [Trifolium pratense]